MWSRDRWTQDWYLAARWTWLAIAVLVAIYGAVSGGSTWVIVGLMLVVWDLFLLRRTYGLRRSGRE